MGNTGALEGLDAVTSETKLAVTFLKVAASGASELASEEVCGNSEDGRAALSTCGSLGGAGIDFSCTDDLEGPEASLPPVGDFTRAGEALSTGVDLGRTGVALSLAGDLGQTGGALSTAGDLGRMGVALSTAGDWERTGAALSTAGDFGRT